MMRFSSVSLNLIITAHRPLNAYLITKTSKLAERWFNKDI